MFAAGCVLFGITVVDSWVASPLQWWVQELFRNLSNVHFVLCLLPSLLVLFGKVAFELSKHLF